MPRSSIRLLTPQNAEELVAALAALRRGPNGEITFAMRAGMIGRTAPLQCGYDRKRKEVRCVFNGDPNLATVFPVSSSAILRRGEPSLVDAYPPPDLGLGEHETRWEISRGRVTVYCSRVVKADELLMVWTDWRSFIPGREEHSMPLAHRPVDLAMFGRICPRV